MTPYYSDAAITLYLGDSLHTLTQLPDASVDCCVTSPPYFGLRDYGTAVWVDADRDCAHEMGDKITFVCVLCGGVRKDQQYGLESSPAEYVETMRSVFAEVRRVLADDGTLWLNIGDSYARGNTGQGNVGGGLAGGTRPSFRGDGASVSPRRRVGGLDHKNLLGMPWRTAFALQDDGWILRSDVIWSKPNAMPESVKDRPSSRHEHLFMLSKSRTYWFDLDPIREPVTTTSVTALNWARDTKEADVPGQSMRQHRADRTPYPDMPPQGIKAATGRQHVSDYGNGGRNPGDVWTIATQPFAAAHFAVMPQSLAERAILAGCKPGGTVLDPFSGSGTTGLAANKHGRKYVGIDLSAAYLDLSLRTRFAQPGLDLSGEATA